MNLPRAPDAPSVSGQIVARAAVENGETRRQTPPAAAARVAPLRDGSIGKQSGPVQMREGLVSLPANVPLLARRWDNGYAGRRGTESRAPGNANGDEVLSSPVVSGGTRPHFAVTRAVTTNWNGSTTDWGVGANWTGGVVPGSTDTANFTSTGLPTASLLNTPQSVAGLTFSTSAQAFTIDGNAALTLGSGGITQSSTTNRQTIGTTGGVVLGASQTWDVANGGLTVSSPISGGSALFKDGTGELTLAGANSFSGRTTVRAGTLTFAATGSGGSGGLVVSNSAYNGLYLKSVEAGTPVTLNVAAANAFSNQTAFALQGGRGSDARFVTSTQISLIIGGLSGGSLTVNVSAANALGQGLTQLSLSGGGGGNAHYTNLPYTGGAGGSVTLNLLAANALSDQTNLILARGANGASATNSTGQTAAGGSGGGVTVNLNGTNQRIGGLESAATTGVVVQNNSATNATLTVGDSASHRYGGLLQNGTGGGTLSLVKEGSGTLTLTGGNTYTGGTFLNAGTLLANNTALGTGGVRVSSGATLSVGSAVNATASSQAVNALTLTSLALTGGSPIPQLTFNLGQGGTSDSLTLTGLSSALTLSNASDFIIGFSSASGSAPAPGGIFNLITFSTPQSVGSIPEIARFHAVGVGNLSGSAPGDGFAYSVLNGQITGLTYRIGPTDTPEPTTLLLIILCGAVPAARLRQQWQTKKI